MKDIKVVLFDLDGTLLPMDQDTFTGAYFKGLVKTLAPHGYDPELVGAAIWAGTKAMIANDGTVTNEEAFWQRFVSLCGAQINAVKPHLDRFYAECFDEVRHSCGFDPEAATLIKRIKEMGYRVVLATNPLFPAVATEKRIAWAGLSPSDFELYTTYENSRYTKPSLDYYRDVLNALSVNAEECMMVGNDVCDDMVAGKLGMKLFLLTRDLINKNGEDISVYPSGNFDDLLKILEK